MEHKETIFNTRYNIYRISNIFPLSEELKTLKASFPEEKDARDYLKSLKRKDPKHKYELVKFVDRGLDRPEITKLA